MNTHPIKKRHKTFKVQVGQVSIGADAPIAVQSMTNTPTQDVDATADQIIQLYRSGAELVRITVNTEAAAQSVPKIKEKLLQHQCNVPLIGDFHYNGHILLDKYPACAQTLDKYRINPGNVDAKHNDNKAFDAIVTLAKHYKKPIRIGANSGSVSETMFDQLKIKHPTATDTMLLEEALVQSVLQSAKRAVELGMRDDQIILSCKVSSIPLLINIYQRLAKHSHYALHLGVTESGPGTQGIVSSSVGIGILLQQGIGDTIRTSITPTKGQERTEEVKVSCAILQSLNLRHFKPTLITCPGCGRTDKTIFEKLVFEVQKTLDENNLSFQKFPNFHRLKIAVMGCVVNGPGESQHADIGLYLHTQGTLATVFAQHKKVATLKGQDIAQQFIALIKKLLSSQTS
jgi:(E)-4-hydroxy-3-methylbut-2-enyl-diphosphate synthase